MGEMRAVFEIEFRLQEVCLFIKALFNVMVFGSEKRSSSHLSIVFISSQVPCWCCCGFTGSGDPDRDRILECWFISNNGLSSRRTIIHISDQQHKPCLHYGALLYSFIIKLECKTTMDGILISLYISKKKSKLFYSKLAQTTHLPPPPM